MDALDHLVYRYMGIRNHDVADPGNVPVELYQRQRCGQRGIRADQPRSDRGLSWKRSTISSFIAQTVFNGIHASTQCHGYALSALCMRRNQQTGLMGFPCIRRPSLLHSSEDVPHRRFSGIGDATCRGDFYCADAIHDIDARVLPRLPG
jgi:hypothetical protein